MKKTKNTVKFIQVFDKKKQIEIIVKYFKS